MASDVLYDSAMRLRRFSFFAFSASVLLACGGRLVPQGSDAPGPSPGSGFGDLNTGDPNVVDAGPVPEKVAPPPPPDAAPQPQPPPPPPPPPPPSTPPYATAAPDQESPVSIVADDANVYWANLGVAHRTGTTVHFTDGTILSMPVGGGPITTIASWQGEPNAVAVHGANVYWVATDEGVVRSAPVGGGAVVTLVSGLNHPSVLAVDDASVYWGTEDGAIGSVPLGGGASVTLVPPQDDTVPFVRGIAVDATRVYWTLDTEIDHAGFVLSIPLAGGSPTTISAAEDRPGAIAVDATSVYWLTYHDGVMKAPLEGLAAGTQPTVLAPGQGYWSILGTEGWACITVSHGTVYLTGGDDGVGTVMSVPVDGGPATQLATSFAQPTGIVATRAGVYWTDMGPYDGSRAGAVLVTPLR